MGIQKGIYCGRVGPNCQVQLERLAIELLRGKKLLFMSSTFVLILSSYGNLFTQVDHLVHTLSDRHGLPPNRP